MTPIAPGFLALHSHRAERLLDTVAHWLQQHPLGPLEEDIILVQSNGVAEWLKMALAHQLGVCAAVRVELPARFIWRTYRQVLGRTAVPPDSALDKLPMTWRLMQLLPGLLHQPAFAPVAGFVHGDGPGQASVRLLQLCSRLADLFDQYQVYRADWLQAWALGDAVLLHADGSRQFLPEGQAWQPLLWQQVLATLSDDEQAAIRPRLHSRVVARLLAQGADEGPGGVGATRLPVARRVVAFGMSHLPWTTLELLHALSLHSQVLLAIPNPCQFHWADIMEGRELLRMQRRRQPLKGGQDLSQLSLADMHAHSHPLLAAWGRQSRDFVRQMDAFDDVAQARSRFPLARLDLFDDADDEADTGHPEGRPPGPLPLLTQVQHAIRDLLPVHEHPFPRGVNARTPDDRSVVFHVAHSPVRELEVLHDQLLALLAQPGPVELRPRDIIVMVPDIEAMAPAIRAVFGQYPRQDRRHIPFDIADLGARASSPVMGALEWLLTLPHQRAGLSELTDLLEVPAVMARFGIAPDLLPRLCDWMAGAGLRWGLHAGHRARLGLDTCGEQNSARFGLQRMLMGFMVGRPEPGQATATGIEPYAEVGGLEASLAGALAHLLQALDGWWAQACEPATPTVWAERGRALLQALFLPADDADRLALDALELALAHWLQACDRAGFDTPVPLDVARCAWMDALSLPALDTRFQAGGVTFCTLMPMRAIPFEVVCLLGMNDADYPRRALRSDFDLMGQSGLTRPGDRSRREDDRQLMLEALMSARRTLYLSWCGRSVRDHTVQPPSVLVSQLQDYLNAAWGPGTVAALTTEHPLQPFSRRYFEACPDEDFPGAPPRVVAGAPALFTHAREWRQAHATPEAGDAESSEVMAVLPPWAPEPGFALTVEALVQFLRHPARVFWRWRMGVDFGQEADETADEEAFGLGGLQAYQLMADLLQALPVDVTPAQLGPVVERQVASVRRSGQLPMGNVGELAARELTHTVQAMQSAWLACQPTATEPLPRQRVHLVHDGVVLDDWLDRLWPVDPADPSSPLASWLPPDGTRLWLRQDAGKLLATAPGARTPRPRPDKLLWAWVHSLALALLPADGDKEGRGVGLLVGRDAVAVIRPPAPEVALRSLHTLLAVWRQGMDRPLPLPRQTALAQASQKGAAAAYEGSHDRLGEVADMAWARLYPDFESLASEPDFDPLAQAVYQPLLAWAEQCVQVHPHPALPGTAQEPQGLALDGDQA